MVKTYEEMNRKELEEEIERVQRTSGNQKYKPSSSMTKEEKEEVFKSFTDRRKLLINLESLRRKTLSTEELEELEKLQDEADATEAGFNESEYYEE
jgi:hypothetical protein